MGTCYSKKRKKSKSFKDDYLTFPPVVTPNVSMCDENTSDTDDSSYEDIDIPLQPVKLQVQLPEAEQKPSLWTPSDLKTFNGAEGVSEQAVSFANNNKVAEDMVYIEMIQMFKPLIVNNLLIHDILPYLLFLENHDDLYELMKYRSQKTAVVRLLADIDKCEEPPEKWKIFLDALSKSGYTYIVDTIRGYIFFNRRYQVEYIKRHTPEIGRMISPPELMPYLIANELLSDTDRDNILCECNNRGYYAGAVLLLDRITRKHGNWYMLFIKALEEASCHDVADILKKEALMENGRFKDIDVRDWYSEVDIYRESQNVVVPTMSNKRALSPQLSVLTDHNKHDLIGDTDECEYMFENQDIEAHHNVQCLEHPRCLELVSRSEGSSRHRSSTVFVSPPVPPRPMRKKAPVPTPRKRFMYYLTPIFVDEHNNTEEESPAENEESKTMFSALKDEVMKLEQEKEKIKIENSLIEKKVEIKDEVIDSLKKRRALLGSLSEKEEEIKALHTVDIDNQGNHDSEVRDGNTTLLLEQQVDDRINLTINDNQVTNGNTSLMLEQLEQLAMINTMYNPLDIPRPHTSLVRARGNITLPIYTLNYDKNAFLLPPQDSGFGTVEYGSNINIY